MAAHAIPRPRGRAWEREAARQAGAAVLVAAVAAALTWLATGQRTLTAAAVVLVVTGSLWMATTRRTSLALALLMVYLGVLDGYVKLATGSQYATFVRDVLLYALVVGLLVRAVARRERLSAPPLSGWVLAFVVCVLIQLANPQAGTLVHSLAGVRQHLEFVPLFFLAFAFVRTTRALRAFVILLALVAALNGVAGWVQFNETPQQFAAWGPGYAERVLGQGNFQLAGRTFAAQDGQNHTRPFGLGSDAGAGGVFGAFALGGILALASLFTRLRYLLFAVAMAIGASVAVISSQGRGVIVGSVVIVLAFGLLTATSRGRVTTLLGFALAATVAFFVAQAVVGSSGSSSLRYQGLDPSAFAQTADTARGRSLARVPDTIASYPLGAGLATAGPASGTAPGASKLTGVLDAENEFSFLTIEAGIPGLLALTGFAVAILALGLRRCRHEPDREARLLLAAIVAPVACILVLFFSSSLTVTLPAGPYLWAAGGIVAYWLVARPAELRRAGGGPEALSAPA